MFLICIVIFLNYKRTEFSSSAIAPGKSDHKNVQWRKKYNVTKFPNEYNFNDYFLTKKTYDFYVKRDNLHLAERLEFNQPPFSLN